MVIHIDAGHGGRWRPNPPQGDPGVVLGNRLESHYTFQYALRLRDVLSAAGFTVRLTRDQDEYTIDNKLRTRETKPGDVFISLHFDSVGGRRLIYYAGLKGGAESLNLARSIDKHFGSGDLRASTSSRFGRLYIDDAKCPAILIEINTIDKADDSEAAMTEFAQKVLSGLREYTGSPSMPFERVFIVGETTTTELSVEKMSIVGNKLYVKTNTRI